MIRREQVHNELSQEERRRILKDTLQHGRARTDASTYAAFGAADDDTGGRFKKNETSRHVVGAAPTPKYPAAASWTADADLPGIEPPAPVDEMIPCGEVFEVAASVASLGETEGEGMMTSSSAVLPGSDVEALPGGHSPPGVSRLASLPPQKRKRKR
jgi:hypothetical protein